MLRAQSVFVVMSLLILAIAFQNCSKVTVSDLTSLDSNIQSVPTPPPTHTETAETLKTMQPALAVRAMTCVLCHAQIHANVITDMGFGTADFMGGNLHFDSAASWYNNLAGAWQSSHIAGTIFVPRVDVTRNAQNMLGANYQNQPLLKLVDFMKVPYNSQYTAYLTAKEAVSEMTVNVIPLPGNDSIVEKPQITIRAPSESEISSLAPELWAGAETSIAKRIGSTQDLQLFKKTGVSGQTYLQNDENVVLDCAKSDIVVRGTLLLRRLKINAAGGCRIYVTGTVFIEEGISYVGGGELQNLQITSSSSVMMGLDSGNITNRLLKDYRGLKIVSRDYLTLANQVVQEAKNIGDLKDAIASYPTRASYDYTGLLLNAPIVHSRYLGLLRGTIISEAILFALGNFHFEFDPVFTKVNVLPLFTAPILSVN